MRKRHTIHRHDLVKSKVRLQCDKQYNTTGKAHRFARRRRRLFGVRGSSDYYCAVFDDNDKNKVVVVVVVVIDLLKNLSYRPVSLSIGGI